jgi:FKBP-type peptidyl-prolyl cis-trans isomerase SlyD
MKRIASAIPALLLLAALVACSPAKVAEKKVVSLSYVLTVDGAVFQQSQPDQPLEFMVGAGKMMPAFETAITGMKVGDKKSFDIKAADAYGEYDKTKTVDVPVSEFGTGPTPKVGDRFTVQTPNGPMPVSVAAVKGTTITIDYNPPLAGKDLSFAVQIIKIRDATKDELAALQTAAQATPK